MDWIKLTEDDIEQAQQQARALPPMPAVLKIEPDDLKVEDTNPTALRPLKITGEDLQTVAPQPTTSAEMSSLEQLMFGLINSARREHLPTWLGAADLTWHDGLAAVARGHSADMLQRQYVAHNSPEGVSAAKRIERYGVRYIACGENIGVVYGAASHNQDGIHEIHKAFMDQPRSLTNHRGNLLNPIWTHVGVGAAYRPDGALIVSQNFMSAPGR